MRTHILFAQGAGQGAYDEDQRLVDSLRRALAPDCDVRYPAIPNEGDVPYDRWRQHIEQELAGMPGPVVAVGHSVGASVLVKWLSERSEETAIVGAFLVACSFWGGDGWRYEGFEELTLQPELAANLAVRMPVYLYHCRDDATVPFEHLVLYEKVLPRATVRAFDNGGHQFGDDLAAVAQDIRALPAERVVRHSGEQTSAS